jgi:hypothetical protein
VRHITPARHPCLSLLTDLLVIHLLSLSLPSRCASCWPPGYGRVFDRSDCFYVAQLQVEGAEDVFTALAAAIDALIIAGQPG